MTGAGVLIADDDALFGSALAKVLTHAGYEVLFEARTGAEAVARLRSGRADVLVVSSALATDPSVLAQAARDGTRMLVLSPVSDHAGLVDALERGAQGYLGKDARLDALLQALSALLRGEAAIPPHMLGGLLHELVQQRRAAGAQGAARLSRRECEVLELLAAGEAQGGIARALVISPQTARTHIQKVMVKLGAHTRAEAVAVARRRGLVKAS